MLAHIFLRQACLEAWTGMPASNATRLAKRYLEAARHLSPKLLEVQQAGVWATLLDAFSGTLQPDLKQAKQAMTKILVSNGTGK